MMKKLTQKQVVLVAEEIRNTVELISQERADDYKVGAFRLQIGFLTDMLINGYDDCFSFDDRLNSIKESVLHTFLEGSPM